MKHTNSPPLEGWRKFERIFDGVVKKRTIRQVTCDDN